ncbi:hypothetical protein SASPL_157784 [Salvia splendens]|uniref:Large ribosomal subunit protein eL14 domain-containing protein n=1 Tax=Salvia splendens TaxID=180675 RepID=A0A8X8VUD6_SALSN|nr:hypothetical protein SASPL_157784 [Salvia splendens]
MQRWKEGCWPPSSSRYAAGKRCLQRVSPVSRLVKASLQMNFKRLSLTDIKIDIKRVPKKKAPVAAMEAADVKGKWEKSSWGRKLIVQKRRASLNDFDRFKLMIAKIKKSGVVRQELAKLKKETAKFIFCVLQQIGLEFGNCS